MTNNRDLAVPEEVLSDAQANEVLRAWVANGGLVCAHRPTTWQDSAAWGIVLSDVARHVANAIRDQRGDDPKETLAKIRDMFNRELISPTDTPTGSFIQ